MTDKATKHEFQAETKQVLDIVVNSLYRDKEIFIRELISNASDALEKLRRLRLTEKEIFEEDLEHEIKVSTDDSSNTLTIQDFGLGMTKEELIENLGTIAHSGSKAFLEAKCFMASLRWAPQYKPPVQRTTTSPCSFSKAESHTGQVVGKTMSLASLGRFAITTDTTFGITSPARNIITVSPILIPKR